MPWKNTFLPADLRDLSAEELRKGWNEGGTRLCQIPAPSAPVHRSFIHISQKSVFNFWTSRSSRLVILRFSFRAVNLLIHQAVLSLIVSFTGTQVIFSWLSCTMPYISLELFRKRPPPFPLLSVKNKPEIKQADHDKQTFPIREAY